MLRRLGVILLATGALLFLASVVLAWWPMRGQERAITIVARRFQYTPNIVRVRRGDIITIRLMSEDVHHGFYLDGYELQTSALPGQDGVVRFVADKAGKFAFRCSVTCGAFHPYMIGYLKVEPDSRFLGATAAVLALFGAAFVAVGARRATAGS
jgi:cytochrome c oxidase subunit 2